jgi:multicomponent Na+:H+ antiporter subunit G
MIALIQDIVAIVFIVAGLFFFLVGVLGLLRMPDVFSRIHTTTKGDTLGVGLVIIGLMVLSGFTALTLKLFITLILVWLTTPTAAHLIAKSEYERDAS